MDSSDTANLILKCHLSHIGVKENCDTNMRSFQAKVLYATCTSPSLTSSSSMVAPIAAALLVSHRARSGRAIPWVPAGTVLDYSASSKHQQLNEMQHEIDVRAGRAPKDLLPTNGPVIMGDDGNFRPLNPHQHTSVRGRHSFSHGATTPIVDRSKPHSLAGGAGQSFGYAGEGGEMSPHDELTMDRAIRDRLKNLKSDGYGPQRRGVVPPPPPIDPDVPRPFHQPQPSLGKIWFRLMGGFVVTGALMLKYGR